MFFEHTRNFLPIFYTALSLQDHTHHHTKDLPLLRIKLLRKRASQKMQCISQKPLFETRALFGNGTFSEGFFLRSDFSPATTFYFSFLRRGWKSKVYCNINIITVVSGFCCADSRTTVTSSSCY